MVTAILELWKDLRHGDVEHQDWLRKKLAAWAKYEFGLDIEYYHLPLDTKKKK